MSRNVITQYYPEIEELVTDDQWASMKRGFSRSSDEIQDYVRDHTEVREFGRKSVRFVMEHPQDDDQDKVFVALGEFGNGITNAAVERARIVRDATVPEATLVYLPNNSVDNRNNLGLVRSERKQLLKGDASPMVHRVQALTEEYADVTILAPSQGASIGGAYLANPNSPAAALAAIEPVNIVERESAVKLISDFSKSGAMLKENIGINDAEPLPGHESAVVMEHLASITNMGFLRYGAGILLPSNLALRGILMKDTFKDDLVAGLEKGSSVAHLWTKPSLISPAEVNTRIARDFSEYPGYFGQMLSGEYAYHTSTNVAAVCVAAVARAHQLRHR